MTLPYVKLELTSAEIRRLVQYRMRDFQIYQFARQARRLKLAADRRKRIELLLAR